MATSHTKNSKMMNGDITLKARC